jgi:nucleoside-diphosphate-sugar epimerase
MRIVVTGAAGFIGSHLCERLLEDTNHEVTGIDAMLSANIARRNLHSLLGHPRFRLIEGDLRSLPLQEVLAGAETIYHLAGMPGVRSSWGADFKKYIVNNIEATQQLLEACASLPIKRFIYASTSSIYGEKTGSVREDAKPEPLSPYGVSKLTGEYLCRVYEHNRQLPIIILRFFTVYGPRQRPDMAFHRFIRSMIEDHPITIYGDGLQTRDFTFIGDGVEAIAVAATADGVIGETINIGGAERASVQEAIAILEELFGRKAKLERLPRPHGEPRHTWADIGKAERLLGYRPRTPLREGLRQQMQDLLELYGGSGSQSSGS